MKNARCYCLLGLLALSVFGQTATQQAWADDETKPAFQPSPIRAPDGFVIELAAAPPLVQYPMMAWPTSGKRSSAP